jgi:hypothetical protein
MMAEAMARLAAGERENADLKSENATLRAENERLRNQVAQWDPHFALKLDLPTPDEALALWRLITARHPRMISPSDSVTDQVAGLVAAMAYVFTCRKTDAPTTKFDGSWWIDRATSFAVDARLHAPRIRSVLLGVIATHDVPYVVANDKIYLDAFGRGKMIDRTAWRKLLPGGGGEPVREPLPTRPPQLDGSIGFINQIPSW